jgi:hypothetical protein
MRQKSIGRRDINSVEAGIVTDNSGISCLQVLFTNLFTPLLSGNTICDILLSKVKYNLLIIFLLSFLLLLSASSVVDAHPGRTDANGGHTCRTNCESWGYGYGEYHYHGGGSSSGGSAGSTYTAPVQETQEVVTLPTNTPIPLRLPTKIPTRIPTKTPTPTITTALTPTETPKPTRTPTKRVTPVQSSVAPKPQGFFAWLMSLFNKSK